MNADIEAIFDQVRGILRGHAAPFTVAADTDSRYVLQHGDHPISQQPMYVAWTVARESYVSFHHLGIVGLMSQVSPALEARKSGKGGFHFRCGDEELLPEIEQLADRGFEIIVAG